MPPDEQERLSALAAYQALDLPPDAAFHRITELAARLFGVPFAHISLVSERRQHFRACYGRTFPDSGREESICTHTIRLPPGEVLVIPDALEHPQFCRNPNVLGPPHLRFYAGAPLRTGDGSGLGSLCLLDTQPREDLTAVQRATLLDLAALIMHEFGRQLTAARLLEADEGRRQAEARLHAVVNHTGDAVYIKDRAGHYLLANPATARLLSLPAADILGRSDAELFGKEDAPRILRIDDEVMRSGQPVTYEREVVVEGQARTFLTTKFPFVLPDGQTHGVVGMSRDISERVRLEQALRDTNSHLERRVGERTRDLERLAYQDPLTGLGNRRAFDAELEALLAGLPLEGAVHLLLLDLNDFKAWNDEHGHDDGDALLRAFARALEHSFRRQDRVYRLGGDEFVVVVQSEDTSHGLLLERVRQAERAMRDCGFTNFSVSAGVASFPAEAGVPGELLRLADGRMLREKAARRAQRRLGTLNGAPPDEPTARRASEVALQALRSTLGLLARGGHPGNEAWAALIEAAVVSVPGAEAGSLYLREGEDFVIRAQVGFSNELLGLRQPAAASLAWYGDPAGWQAGKARVIAGAAIDQHSGAVNEASGLPHNRQLYQEHGEIGHLHASLCVPVVQEGQVVAQLNLDNLRFEGAFGRGAAEIAEEFATQVGALLAARARQEREAARRRELEGLAAVNAAMRLVRTPLEAKLVLTRQTAAIMGTEHVVLLRHEAAQDALVPIAPGGLYARQGASALPRGSGLAWAALERGEVVQAPALAGDSGGPRGAVLAAPLRAAEGEPLGVLLVARDGDGTFSELDAQLLGAIASAGVTAITRARAARAESERAEEFRMLAELSALVGGLDDPALVAEQSLGICCEFLAADFAAVAAPAARLGVEVGAAPGTFHAAMRGRSGPMADALSRLGQPDSFAATHDYAAEPYAVPELVAAGVGATVFVPVARDGQVVGLVNLVWFRALPALPPAATALARRAAELIGQALERQAHLRDVEATREGALLALGRSLELRDFETAGHTERVVALASRLGRAAGLHGPDLEGLRQGAYLHDLGKLAVPDRILLKPGRLDPGEWAVMQAHAAVGSDLIRSIPTLHPRAREVVRHHHERWDGTGYPDRLAGEDIPLLARLFSVVDVYDALTSARPYKPAWSHREALAEIAAQAGRQFDPRVAEVFTRLLGERLPDTGGGP